jgi:hypothetical protein
MTEGEIEGVVGSGFWNAFVSVVLTKHWNSEATCVMMCTMSGKFVMCVNLAIFDLKKNCEHSSADWKA